MSSGQRVAPNATADVSASAGGGFQRKSSGLVRDFSPMDSWIYNVLAINPVVVGALTFGLVLLTYPGANLWLTFVIAGLFCCAEAVTYALFATAMPRSGGDYVMQSRVLGGGVATFFSFGGIVLSLCFTAGIFGFILSSVVLAPFLVVLGAQTNAHWLTSAGTWLGTDWGVFVCALFVAIQGLLVNIRGLALYGRIQRWAFWPGLVLLAFFMILMLASSGNTFHHNLDAFMGSHFGTQHAYAKTLAAGGSFSSGFSLSATIKGSVIAAFLLIFPAYSVQQAGEIRRAGSVRANLLSTLGAEAFCFVAMALLGALLVAKVGSHFLFASTSLYFGGGHTPLPVPPFLGFFFIVIGNSPILTVLVLIMSVCWAFMLPTNAWVGGSRIMMAMSFDQILPAWFGRVDRRLHVPLNSLLVFTAVMFPLAALYVFAPSIQQLTISYFIILLTAFGATMVAGIVFPWVRPRMYQSSAIAKYKLFGLPLISVTGTIFLVFVVYCDYQAVTADALGVNSTKGLSFLAGLWGVAFIVYWASKLYRRSRSELISTQYQELPIE
jgi:basic amino acid/polyamine antiporter, APA family